VLREFGPPSHLSVADVPDPVPGTGQVLIEVAAAGITFVETQVRAGRGPNPAMAPELPMTPGNGVSGTVIAVGDGADPGLVGTLVVTTTGGSGGYAEQVAVDASQVIVVPPGLGPVEAVALLADGRTAAGLFRAVDPQAGEWVLVEAAAGGVGSLLVQLARSVGARVVAAAGSLAKLRIAGDLGADVLVDYTEPAWAQHVRDATGGRGVDVVFESVGGGVGTAAASLLADGGRLCVFGVASGTPTTLDDDDLARRRVHVIGLGALAWSPADMRALSQWALAESAAGRLRPTIGQTFPLADAAVAHAAIEARTTVGKTVLIP